MALALFIKKNENITWEIIRNNLDNPCNWWEIIQNNSDKTRFLDLILENGKKLWLNNLRLKTIESITNTRALDKLHK